MFVRFVYLFFIVILFTAFDNPKHCRLANRLKTKYVKEVADPKGLQLVAYGGAMMGDIQEIEVGFVSSEVLTVDEARVLYVNLINEFLCRINSDKEIRPYLHNYPFEFSNLDFRLSFENPENGEVIDDGHVAYIYVGKNDEILYRGYNKNESLPYYGLHQETYEDALKIVKEENVHLECGGHASAFLTHDFLKSGGMASALQIKH